MEWEEVIKCLVNLCLRNESSVCVRRQHSTYNLMGLSAIAQVNERG